MMCELQDKIFDAGPADFDDIALAVFRFQYANNAVYRAFADAVGKPDGEVRTVHDIPFLPVRLFKEHDVVSGVFTPERVFGSSGTTQTGNSRHLVKSISLYEKSYLRTFRLFYGDPSEWCIIGLLPSYLERTDSSLVNMVEGLIRLSGHSASGFYLDEFDKLIQQLRINEAAAQKTLLIGVTFALLDLAAMMNEPLRHTVIMETGGMKGKRKEIVREEVHKLLKAAWQLKSVHSEYGMTELLSQAYSFGDGLFRCPPWMKITIREEDDPLSVVVPQSNVAVRGLVNVIDLANLYSCSFIATDDMGSLYPDGSFEITGRLDASDVRGCSLLYL